mmetsp:Transcript_29041/g.77518  ORF Transcript_29041/g.77518 Transcript_29041/m.77518 type:complete len:241 (+) Transcript_29041:25-747(+)
MRRGRWGERARRKGPGRAPAALSDGGCERHLRHVAVQLEREAHGLLLEARHPAEQRPQLRAGAGRALPAGRVLQPGAQAPDPQRCPAVRVELTVGALPEQRHDVPDLEGPLVAAQRLTDEGLQVGSADLLQAALPHPDVVLVQLRGLPQRGEGELLQKIGEQEVSQVVGAVLRQLLSPPGPHGLRCPERIHAASDEHSVEQQLAHQHPTNAQDISHDGTVLPHLLQNTGGSQRSPVVTRD